MSKNFIIKNVFNCVVNSKRTEVVEWLCSKYHGLRLEDSEDIVQESSIELWKKVHDAIGLKVLDIVKLWKAISRNQYTHWLRSQRFTDEWDDGKLQYDWEERDFCWDRGNFSNLMKREVMYDYIEHLPYRDRKLMEMVLVKKSMTEICNTLGFTSTQVARNRKCRILCCMKEDIGNRLSLELHVA